MLMRAIKNPWVIGGGLLAGLLVMLMRGSNSGAAQSSSIDYLTAANLASAGNMARNAELSATLSADMNRTTVAREMNVLGAASNMFAAATEQTTKLAEISSGIFKTQIQSQTAIALDRQQNAARLDMVEIQDAGLTTRTLANIGAQLGIANISARSALFAQTIDAGVKTHQIDVSSRTAIQLGTIQADTTKTVAGLQSQTAVAVASLNAQTQQAGIRASTENAKLNLAGNVLGGVFSLGKSMLSGGLAPTSSNPNPRGV
jgi:hypothetical protein